MRIDIWLDYVCPFCYLGTKRLDQALAELGMKDAELVYHSFELDPQAKRHTGMSVPQQIADKYDMPLEEAEAMHEGLAEQGRELGLAFAMDQAVPTNTHAAHRVAQRMQQQSGAQVFRWVDAMFEGHFAQGLDIGDEDVLAELSQKAGFDAGLVQDALSDAVTEAAVEADIQQARSIGVQGVPFFVFNRTHAVSGAQPTELFVQALEQLRDGADSEAN